MMSLPCSGRPASRRRLSRAPKPMGWTALSASKRLTRISADALGITACLYAYSHLSFSDGRFARVCAAHYYHLRSYAMQHAEVSAILGATD